MCWEKVWRIRASWSSPRRQSTRCVFLSSFHGWCQLFDVKQLCSGSDRREAEWTLRFPRICCNCLLVFADNDQVLAIYSSSSLKRPVIIGWRDQSAVTGAPATSSSSISRVGFLFSPHTHTRVNRQMMVKLLLNAIGHYVVVNGRSSSHFGRWRYHHEQQQQTGWWLSDGFPTWKPVDRSR